MKCRAFTLLELMMAAVVLAILAAAVMPTTQKIVKRQKELELKRVLMEMRDAIDRYKKATDDGVIAAGDIDQLGYPEDLDKLVEGVPLKKDTSKNMRFLRRIPVDPMTGEAEWGRRSVQDDPDDNTWGGENVFDVYSESDGSGLNETDYSDW